MSEFALQFPHVFVGRLRIVDAEFVENFLKVGNGLLRDSDEILEGVVLMLLEGGEEHFLDFVFVGSLLLRPVFLLILEFDQIGVIRNRLVGVHDSVGYVNKFVF